MHYMTVAPWEKNFFYFIFKTKHNNVRYTTYIITPSIIQIAELAKPTPVTSLRGI